MAHIGLDIGTHGLRLVELRKSGKGFRLLAIASSDVSGRGILSESEKDHQDLAAVVRKMVEEAKISTREIVIGLPESVVFSRLIRTPKLTDEELASSMAWEAEQYIPVPLEEVTLDWEVVSRPAKGEKEKEMEVFLVAAPTQMIEKYAKIIKLAGFAATAVETESIALVRSLVKDLSSSVVLVDFGASTTDLVVVRQGKIMLTRSIPTGGAALTRALEGVLKVEEKKAEEYKKIYGLKEGLEGKIKRALTPILGVVVTEIKKSINYYQVEQKDTALNLIILSGGTAKMPEVANFLAEKLGMEVQIADPFANLIKDHVADKFLADASLFSVAVGLAMKDL